MRHSLPALFPPIGASLRQHRRMRPCRRGSFGLCRARGAPGAPAPHMALCWLGCTRCHEGPCHLERPRLLLRAFPCSLVRSTAAAPSAPAPPRTSSLEEAGRWAPQARLSRCRRRGASSRGSVGRRSDSTMCRLPRKLSPRGEAMLCPLVQRSPSASRAANSPVSRVFICRCSESPLRVGRHLPRPRPAVAFSRHPLCLVALWHQRRWLRLWRTQEEGYPRGVSKGSQRV